MKLKHLLLSCIALTAVSCQKSEISNPSTEPVETIIGAVVETNKDKSAENLNAFKASYTAWTRVSRDDMNKMLGSSDYNWYATRFASKIGSGTQKPVNVCVNGERLIGRSDSQNPVPMYSWWCDRRLNVAPAINGTKGALVTRRVPGTSILPVNNYLYSVKEYPSVNMFSTTVQVEHSWFVSATAGITVTGSVGLPFGIANGEVSVSLSVEAGGGGSHSVGTTQNIFSPLCKIPARGHAEFTLWESYYPQRITYPVPLELRGYVGADYGAGSWNGSHYWALDANTFWPEYKAGTVKYNAVIDEKLSHKVWIKVQTFNYLN